MKQLLLPQGRRRNSRSFWDESCRDHDDDALARLGCDATAPATLMASFSWLAGGELRAGHTRVLISLVGLQVEVEAAATTRKQKDENSIRFNHRLCETSTRASRTRESGDWPVWRVAVKVPAGVNLPLAYVGPEETAEAAPAVSHPESSSRSPLVALAWPVPPATSIATSGCCCCPRSGWPVFE